MCCKVCLCPIDRVAIRSLVLAWLEGDPHSPDVGEHKVRVAFGDLFRGLEWSHEDFGRAFLAREQTHLPAYKLAATNKVSMAAYAS